jgi:hypothetical protein
MSVDWSLRQKCWHCMCKCLSVRWLRTVGRMVGRGDVLYVHTFLASPKHKLLKTTDVNSFKHCSLRHLVRKWMHSAATYMQGLTFPVTLDTEYVLILTLRDDDLPTAWFEFICNINVWQRLYMSNITNIHRDFFQCHQCSKTNTTFRKLTMETVLVNVGDITRIYTFIFYLIHP